MATKKTVPSSDTEFVDKKESPISWEDLKTFILVQLESKKNYMMDIYKNYYMFNQDRAEDLKKSKQEWRSNIVSPITFSFTSAWFSKVLDSELRMSVLDTIWKYSEKKWKNWNTAIEDVLGWWEYIMSLPENRDTYIQATFDAYLLWWWVVKTLLTQKEIDIPRTDANWAKQKISSKYYIPQIKYVSPFNFFVYWEATNLDDARFRVERKFIPSKKYKNYCESLWIIPKEKEVWDSDDYIDIYDYEAIKVNMPFYNSSEWRNILDDETYSIKNKMIEVYEVHEDKYITVFANWILHPTVERKWPFLWSQHKIISYKQTWWTVFSVWMWYILKALQRAYDVILNNRIDNVILLLNKQFILDSRQNIFWSNYNSVMMEPWKIHKVPWWAGNLSEIQMTEIKASAYNEVDALFQIIQVATWLSSMQLWVQWKVERNATSADIIRNAWDLQLKQVIKSLNWVLADVFRQILLLTVTMVPDDVIARELWAWNQLKTVDVIDLVNWFKFNFEMVSDKAQSTIADRDQLMQFIQMAGWIRDSAGKPVVDLQQAVEKLLEKFSLSQDLLLTDDEFKKEVITFSKIEWEAQAEAQKSAQQLMWQQQQSWATGVPLEMMSNPEWQNEQQTPQ